MRQEPEARGIRIGKGESTSTKHDAKIAEIEHKITALQLRSDTGEPAGEETSFKVIFNISSAGMVEQAKEWLIKLCLDESLQVLDMYSKASNYSGVLFAK